ncbi:Ankyrin 2 [Phytophthora cinnamomi]|uniref:Ankyrin 2 n=1 Tax=Phytophthora cinnamomi TaxID=4785 RepID=UPI00355AAD5D|nr:Ankyrin 2 [Phytophthora cinnamomi]
MEQRLAALRRDQEIDGLRVYLIKYNLFPRNRDPHNSPIRLEELKELVKHWKLHRQRGFWRDHPDKDDLVRALLQHIKSEAANKKRRQDAQDKYRSKTLSGADDGSPGKLRDLTTFFGGGNANGGGEGDQNGSDNDREQAVAIAKKKNFGGDLFYQRGDYDEGLIYLSRIDKSRFQSESHNPCQDLLTTSASAPTPLNRLLLGGDAVNKHKSAGVAAASDKEAERELNQMPAVTLSPILTGAVNTTLLTKDMKLKSVEGLYSISCHKGYEAQLLHEGALVTLSSLLKQDDPAIRLYAAAAILNLTHYIPVPISPLPTPVKKAQTRSPSSSLAMAPSQAARDLYAEMMDESVIAALLDLVHTPHPTVKALCARALLRFTIDETHHFAMVHEGVVTALSQIMTTVPTTMTSPLAAPNDVKLLCVLALVNLADVPRAVTCDALLSTIVVLARHGDTATRKICAQAILNLSILPTTRGVIVDEGAVAALEVLTTVAIRPPLQLTLLETITCTLCNLAAVKTNQDALTKNSGLNILSDILTNVGAELRRMHEGVITDTDSAEGEAMVASLLCVVRKNCVNAIAMLCCNPKLQVRIRNASFIPKLLNILRKDGYDEQDDDYSDDDSHASPNGDDRRMSASLLTQRASVDPETEKFVVVALANLALDDRCRPTLVQDGAVPIFLGLLHTPDMTGSVSTEEQIDGATDRQNDKRVAALLLKLDCVTALSNLLLHPANFQALVDAGVVPSFLDLIRNEETAAPGASNSSKEIQKACVYAMLGLAKDPGMKTRLAETTQKRLDGKEASDQVGAIPTINLAQ